MLNEWKCCLQITSVGLDETPKESSKLFVVAVIVFKNLLPSLQKCFNLQSQKILHPASLRPSGSLPPSNVPAHLPPARQSPHRCRRSPRCLVAPGEANDGRTWLTAMPLLHHPSLTYVCNSVVFAHLCICTYI